MAFEQLPVYSSLDLSRSGLGAILSTPVLCFQMVTSTMFLPPSIELSCLGCRERQGTARNAHLYTRLFSPGGACDRRGRPQNAATPARSMENGPGRELAVRGKSTLPRDVECHYAFTASPSSGSNSFTSSQN